MSFDLGVWYPYVKLSNKQAGELYVRLCESEFTELAPHISVDAFYGELTSKHPEIDTIPDDLIDDHDLCPWSCALDRSPAHVIMPCVWSKAEYVHSLVHSLAAKHGLAVYDPQSELVTYPPDHSFAAKSGKPWWQFW
jgi:hypothetical protein